MRHILLILLLLFYTPADAMMLIAGSPPSGGSIACAGDQIFGWSMEDFNLETGTPTGCNDELTEDVTNSGGAIAGTVFQDGSNSLLFTDSADYAQIAVSGVGTNVGTIDLYTYNVTSLPVAYVVLADLAFDADNRAFIQYNNSSDRYRCGLRGNATTVAVESTQAVSADTWVHVVCKWDISEAGGNSLSITVDSTETTSTDNLTAVTTQPDTLTLYDASTSDIRWDLIKVYSTWQ